MQLDDVPFLPGWLTPASSTWGSRESGLSKMLPSDGGKPLHIRKVTIE
jgi:hypothetical protein